MAGSELGVAWADFVAKKLGLPGNSPASSQARRDKFAMQQALHKADIPCLRTVSVSQADQCFELCRAWAEPVVLKPLSGAGSQGVHFCRDPEEAVRRFRQIMAEVNFFVRPIKPCWCSNGFRVQNILSTQSLGRASMW